MLEAIEAVAVEAVQAGGSYLRAEFEDGNAAGDYRERDVKAEADTGAEERMLPIIREAFPDHDVYAEESGELGGESEFRWIVDPLDGTNNFTCGMPSFASVVSVLRNGEPVVAAVSLPALDDVYVARNGAGVRLNGERVQAKTDCELSTATLVLVLGQAVTGSEAGAATADDLTDAMRSVSKRVVRSWSPAVHAALCSRGLLDGLVVYKPDQEERYAMELLARESGMTIEVEDDRFAAATNDDLYDGVSAAIEDVW